MNGIEARVRAILAELEEGNGYGEPVTLVAATKTSGTSAKTACRNLSQNTTP